MDITVPFSGSLEQRLVEDILERADVFALASFEPLAQVSLYSHRGYLDHHRSGGAPVRALLDRNLLSPLIRAGRGQVLPCDDSSVTLAAALMAFTAAAGIELEPSLALYEVAGKTSHEAAREELALFRIAEATCPFSFENIALGRMDRVAPSIVADASTRARNDAIPDGEFARSLVEWKRHRLALSKLAVLMRSTTGLPGMMELLRWSEDDAYFDGLVLVLATVVLSDRRDNRVLKGVFSNDPQKRLDGVDNAAWDLTYVSQLKKWIDASPELWLLCTADKPLRHLARVALGLEGGGAEIVKRYWRAKGDAELLLREHERASAAAERPRASREPEAWLRELAEMQDALSAQLRT